MEYCKGEYKTSIEYFGEDYRSYGGNYALNLSWGMESLYEQWQGTACR